MATKSEGADFAFQAIADAHPVEVYGAFPEQFWLYFHSKNPDIKREEMEEMLVDYEKAFWKWYRETYCERKPEERHE